MTRNEMYEMNAVNPLQTLPHARDIRVCLQSMAMLDAILSYRFGECVYSFAQRWKSNQSVGSIRNGQGDDLFFVFDSHGCFLKGWVHDIALASNTPLRKSLRALVPTDYRRHLSEPAFTCDEATFFAWQENGQSRWNSTTAELAFDVDDGSEYLLGFLRFKPSAFQQWAEENYETALSLDVVIRAYRHEPLSIGLVNAVDSNVNFEAIREQALKIGFPVA